eukprot:SAG11_NODE_15307_length_582_cov_1.068323_1_plen_84_part_00
MCPLAAPRLQRREAKHASGLSDVVFCARAEDENSATSRDHHGDGVEPSLGVLEAPERTIVVVDVKHVLASCCTKCFSGFRCNE